MLKSVNKKGSSDIRFLRIYDVFEVNGISKVIHPVTD